MILLDTNNTIYSVMNLFYTRFRTCFSFWRNIYNSKWM